MQRFRIDDHNIVVGCAGHVGAQSIRLHLKAGGAAPDLDALQFLTRTPMGMHSGPCSLIDFYGSMHIGAAVENFFKVENVLGSFGGFKEKMAQGKEPAVRKSVFPVRSRPKPGPSGIDEDWLRSHLAKGETWWG